MSDCFPVIKSLFSPRSVDCLNYRNTIWSWQASTSRKPKNWFILIRPTAPHKAPQHVRRKSCNLKSGSVFVFPAAWILQLSTGTSKEASTEGADTCIIYVRTLHYMRNTSDRQASICRWLIEAIHFQDFISSLHVRGRAWPVLLPASIAHCGLHGRGIE